MATLPLDRDEHVVFRGTRGGQTARGILWGFLMLFLGLQACGLLTTLSLLGKGELEGNQLVLASGDHRVAFELAPADAERARAFTKLGPHAYR
jgi:hypothetical protein